MNQILNLIRLIPRSGRYLAVGIVIFGALFFVYRRFGMVSALVIAVGIGFIFLGLFIYKLLLKDKEKREAKAFNKDLKASQGASKEELRDAVQAVSGKWEQAQADLAKANVNLYELPWYMLIGEPQSGKSTTLKKSGLKFPVGEESITGSGGTRNCDWWFTEEGVILDTAGRFTFQEQAATDSAEWNHFLKLLTRHRPLCPVNGVLLVIPVDSLLADDAATRHQKALNISEKLNHIQKVMGIQFPVFVLLTKADVIYGFTEFFNKLSPDQQREMFGWSNPNQQTGFDIPTFNLSFQQLIDRIDQVRKRNLSRPQYSDDADKTFIFPEEFKALQEPLREYMSVIFEESKYKDPLMFRGYYFSSGMQEGVPIAKACQSLVGDQAAAKRLEQVFTKQRAFFIRDFYTEKVFPEQGLVQRAPKYAQRDRIKKRVVTALNATLLIFGILFSIATYWHLSKSLVQPMQAIDEALGTFESVGSHYFSDQLNEKDRIYIYDSLHKLHEAIEDGKDINYLLVFRGRDNPLTRNLQNTFSYLYLDKIMTGIYQSVETQLRDFNLRHASNNSEENLADLVVALNELKRWRLHHERGQLADLEPTIEPFLRIALDPAWDAEVVQRSQAGASETLDVQFSAWFDEVYRDSSPDVRAFLVAEMVKRTNDLFENLDRSVLNFYHQQPEFLLYQDKLAARDSLERQYDELTIQSLGYARYQQALKDFETTYHDVAQRMDNAQDRYLAFPVIRERIVTTLGDAFVTLGNPEDNPSRDQTRIREDLPRYVHFVRKLKTIQPGDYRDPRGDSEASLQMPDHLASVHELIVHPYLNDYLNYGGTRYEDFPQPGLDANGNLEELFKVGAERGNLLSRIFLENTRTHRQAAVDANRARDLENALNSFYAEDKQSEGQRFLETLSRVLPAGQLEAPPPSNNRLTSLVGEFNDLTEDGNSFDAFLAGPRKIQDLFDEYEDAWDALPFDSREMERAVEDYKLEAFANLKDFHDAVNALTRINYDRLANNRGRSASQFAELASVQKVADLDTTTMPLLERHRRSLAAWADAITESFKSWTPPKPDSCPRCTRALRNAKSAARDQAGTFPLDFTGNAKITGEERGLVTYEVALMNADQLDDVLAAIDMFRNPSPTMQVYLADRNLTNWMEDAIAWADGVVKIREGTITLKAQYRRSDDPDTIARDFTLCEIRGVYQSQRMSLNSPRPRDVAPGMSPDPENPFTEIRVWNDAEGNDAESILRIDGSAIAFFGFILDDSTSDTGRRNFLRTMVFELDFLDQTRTATFQFELSQPVPPAPDWSKIR